MQWLSVSRVLQVFVLSVLITIPMCSYYASVQRTGVLRSPVRYVSRSDSSFVRDTLLYQPAFRVSPTLPTKTTTFEQSTSMTTRATSSTRFHDIIQRVQLASMHSIRNDSTTAKSSTSKQLNSTYLRSSGLESIFNKSNSNVRTQTNRKPVRVVPLSVHRQSSSADLFGSESQSRPKAVLILTSKRSGSSFVGELFNQHPDIFYFFEPLQSLDHLARSDRRIDQLFSFYSNKILDGIMRCDFHSEYPRGPGRLSSNRNLCTYNSRLRDICKDRVSISYLTAEPVCRQQKLVATKVIRVHDIGILEDMLVDSEVDWRIIHLVRDPRPTERSRSHTRPNYNLIRRKGTDENDEVDLCETLERNSKYWLDTPVWLRGRYKMVRFEDIASSPHEYAEELLKFAGVGMSETVTKWIKENTEVRKPVPLPEHIARRLRTKNDIPDEFTTTRNTAEVLERWRLDMDWAWVQRIQKVCNVAMATYGYAMMPDNRTLRNMEVSSTLPLPEPSSRS